MSWLLFLQGGKVNSIDFHRKDDLLVTASEDDSVRLYDIANAKWVYTQLMQGENFDIWGLFFFFGACENKEWFNLYVGFLISFTTLTNLVLKVQLHLNLITKDANLANLFFFISVTNPKVG